MTDDEVQELLRGLRTRRVEAGGVVFRKDDPGDGLYFVTRGRILIVAESADGRELILNAHDPGELFGEIALLDGAGRSATAVAYEPSEVGCLGRDRFLSFIKARPEAMIRMVALLCGRLRRSTELVEDSAFLDVPTRLAKLVLTLLDGKAIHPGTGPHPGADAPATLKLTQRDLALMLGVSREFVGKTLALWREAGMVEIGRRRLKILDMPALERVVVGSAAGRPRLAKKSSWM